MNTLRIFDPPLQFDGTPERWAVENERAQNTTVQCFAVWDFDLSRAPIYRRYPRVISWLRRLLRLKPQIVGYRNAIADVFNAMKGV